MRKLLTVSVAVLLAGALTACEQQPTTPDAKASHDAGDVDNVTAEMIVVDTDAAALNGLTPGEQIGTIDFSDDQSADRLTITGSVEAGTLDPTLTDDSYRSLIYDIESPGPGEMGACEPGLGLDDREDDDRSLSIAQMETGEWDVASDSSATLGPRTKSGRNYVTLDDDPNEAGPIGTVSIRDTRVDNGFGPDAVVACGNVGITD